jgi:translocation and assembly module TamB
MTTPSDQPLLPKPRRRVLAAARRVALTLVVALGGLLCAVAWIGLTDSGIRLFGAALAPLSGGRLHVDGVEGRLFGSWRAQSLRWSDETQEIELRQLTLSLTPRALLDGQLAFERIEAASLRFFSPPDSAASTLPERLQLPLAVQVNVFRLGQLLLGEASGSATLVAENIDAALASDGSRHRLERFDARLGLLALSGQATLDGQPPFAVTARAALSGAARGQRFALELLGSGPLDRIMLDGKAAAGAESGEKPAAPGVSGDVHAVLTPFARIPFASLRVQLNRVDPAQLVAGAPKAQLDVELDLASVPEAAGKIPASGRLRISNRQSGRLDRQLLPIESLHGDLHWQGEVLAVDGLVLALAGGGRIDGRGRLDGAQLDLDLVAGRVDANALHGSLPSTRLAGPLRAQLGIDRQRIDVNWRDSRYSLNAAASIGAPAIEIERLQLSSGGASLAAQGRLALTGERRFAAQGRLRNFDPQRFLKAAAGIARSQINAGFEASGALAPALELALRFDLRDSRIAGQPLSGKGRVDLSGSRLRAVDIDLDAAGNRLRAAGAWGRSGDALRLTLQAPKLGAIGWSGLTGEAKATVDVAGSAENPEFSAQLQVARLHLGSWLDVGDLSLSSQLAAGAQGALSGELRCTACALPAAGIPALALEVKVDGRRQQHHLAARLTLPEKRELRLALDGGFQPAAGRKAGAAATWRGILAELRLSQNASGNAVPLVELAAPAALQVGADFLSFGPATIGGRVGMLTIDRLGLEKGRWQSAGRLRQFRPQQLLIDFPALASWREVLGIANAQPLIVAGEWDLALGDKPAGRAALWRESGDLLLGALPLGLGDARLQASLGDGKLAASALLRGARLGEISAEISTTIKASSAAPGGSSPLIDAQAPWEGRLQASVPDLAWLGPLLGEGWQLAGQLQGQMRLAGSAARPQFSGEWRGDKLALRALDQGMRLERGLAIVEITPERLLLRRLAFESDFQPLPRELQLDGRINAARLFSTPGRLEASGELAFAEASAGSAARLDVHLDRVGVMQKPDQWVAVSGDGEIRIGERLLDAGGKLRVDAGFWALAPAGRPSLSDDVVLRSAQSGKGGSRVGRAFKLDLELALGRNVHFRGAGVDSRLAGDLRIRSDDAGLPRATGSISTVDGRFDAYGQKLAIERGIVNFQGPIDNPGLNLLAVRQNLAVEAGVEVTGTAQRPQIRLVSTPNVPDAEKLSWLVLGHSPEQQGGGESALLLAAAQTIFGGQDGGALRQLQRGLGIDEFGVSSGQVGGSTSLPTSRVASSTGFGGSQSVNGQIVSVGKRLSANALLSYEQSLNTTESLVKLTVNLNRQFSVVARAGSDSALDFFWNYSFGR